MRPPNLFNVNGRIGKSAYETTDFPTVNALIKHLDYLGIERSLAWHLAARDINPTFGNLKLLEEIAAAGAEDRIIPAFIITPACFYASGVLESLKKVFAAKQVRAIRLTPEVCRFPLRRIERVLAELAEFEPLILWDVKMIDQNSPDVEYLAKRFPQINFALTQIMWPPFGAILDLMWRCPNIYIDTSWLHMRESIELLCRDFGAERILFGIGLKSHYGAAIAELAFAQISDAERELIAHGNIERLLDIPASRKQISPCLNADKPLWEKFSQGEPLREVPIIDAHAHDQLPDMGWFMPETSPGESAKAFSRQSERLAINLTIVCSGIALFGDGVEGNLATEQAFKDHGSFKGYLGFNPRFSEDLTPRFDAFFSRDFYVGFKLLSDYWKIPVTDPSYNPVWEYADKHHLPILLHTWGGNFDSPGMLAEIVPKYPNAIFLLGHSGGSGNGRQEAIELALNNDNVYLEFCGSFTVPELYEEAIVQVGIDKVVFGSDTLGHSVVWELGRFLSLPLNDDELLPALARNMERILQKRQ